MREENSELEMENMQDLVYNGEIPMIHSYESNQRDMPYIIVGGEGVDATPNTADLERKIFEHSKGYQQSKSELSSTNEITDMKSF